MSLPRSGAGVGPTSITGPRTVAELGEFGLIARISAGLSASPAAIVGPGDDAAVLSLGAPAVVVSTDLVLEHRHFRRDWSTANDVGHKAAARNFADIVAMGARPVGLVVGLGCPGDTELSWIDGLVAGLNEECGELGAAVVGGDVSVSDSILLAVTAIGDLDGREPVTLGGARAGDVVAFAGRLGWAAAGFAVLSRGFRSPVGVVNAHRRPEPAYSLGLRAGELGATAMTDVSDGLVADLGHIAAASGVGIELDGRALVAHAKLADVGSALNTDPLTWVLTGGDDYAFVATFPSGADLEDGWTVIGVVGDGSGVRVDGRRWPQGGHEHFR